MATTTTTPASSSHRYSLLLEGLNKVLVESRKKLDIPKAVEIGYGKEDRQVLGATMLEGVMEAMLDRLDQTVEDKLKAYLASTSIEQQLEAMERIMKRLDQVQAATKVLQEHDRTTAQQAATKAQLPLGVTPQIVLQAKAYQLLLQQKQHMEQELTRVETETTELQQKYQQAQARVESQMQQVQQIHHELDRTADVCATIS